MLLTVPTELLIVILAFIIIAGGLIVGFIMSMHAKEKQEIKDQPERIKKKSDPPDAGDVDEI